MRQRCHLRKTRCQLRMRAAGTPDITSPHPCSSKARKLSRPAAASALRHDRDAVAQRLASERCAAEEHRATARAKRRIAAHRDDPADRGPTSARRNTTSDVQQRLREANA